MKTSERLKSLKQAEPFVLRLADGRRIPEITAKHMRIMPGGAIPAQFAAARLAPVRAARLRMLNVCSKRRRSNTSFQDRHAGSFRP